MLLSLLKVSERAHCGNESSSDIKTTYQQHQQMSEKQLKQTPTPGEAGSAATRKAIWRTNGKAAIKPTTSLCLKPLFATRLVT